MPSIFLYSRIKEDRASHEVKLSLYSKIQKKVFGSALVSVTLEQGRSEAGFPASLSFRRAFISLLSLQQWRADYLFKKQIPSFIISPGQILFKVISTVWWKANGRRSLLDPYSNTKDLHLFKGTRWLFLSHSSPFISDFSFLPVLAELGKGVCSVMYSSQHQCNSLPLEWLFPRHRTVPRLSKAI